MVFFSLTTVAFATFIAATEWIVRDKVIPRHSDYKYAELFRSSQSPNAVFGDSHAAYSITGLKDFVNLAFGGDKFANISWKLRTFFDQRKPGKIILQAGPHHFSRGFMNFREDNSEDFSELLAGYPKYTLRLIRPPHRKELFEYWKIFLTGRDFLTRQTFVEDGARLNTGLYSDIPMSIRIPNARRSARILAPVKDFFSSRTARIYRETLEFATKRGARVCLVSFPVTNLLYQSMEPIETYAQADQFFNGLAEQFGAVRLNLRKVRLPDKYFADAHHLNRTGAIYISGIVERECFPN